MHGGISGFCFVNVQAVSAEVGLSCQVVVSQSDRFTQIRFQVSRFEPPFQARTGMNLSQGGVVDPANFVHSSSFRHTPDGNGRLLPHW